MTSWTHIFGSLSRTFWLALIVTANAEGFGCSCAAGFPELDAAQSEAGIGDAALDSGRDATLDASADAAIDAMPPSSCGNGNADEFEACDPSNTHVSGEQRCDCADAKPCTRDQCAAGTSAEMCNCVCEHPLDATWYANACGDGLACTLDTVTHYDTVLPADPATCDVGCSHVLDGNWYAASLTQCTAAKPACLSFSSNAFTYDDETPSDMTTCDASCHYALDAAWLASTCNDGDACTTEAPTFLQDANTIATTGVCTTNVAYTCNRNDTRSNVELCNGVDDDCDTVADDGCPTGISTSDSTLGTAFGGGGGSAFESSCPTGSVLVGFDGRSAERVDQLTSVCAPLVVVPVNGVPERSYLVQTGTPFTSYTAGGTGGTDFIARCPAHQVVTGMQGRYGDRVFNIGFSCGTLSITRIARSWVLSVNAADTTSSFGNAAGTAFTYACPAGMIGSGFAGRSGTNVDQVSLTCAFPSIAGTTNVAYNLVARHSGACADVLNASLVDGGAVIQWGCNQAANQKWEMQSTNDGYIRFRAAHSGRCLDVTNFSTTAGTPMEQWDCWTGAPQRFSVVDLANGYHHLVAQVSNLCVEVDGSSGANGTAIVQRACGTSMTAQNQQWQLVVVP